MKQTSTFLAVLFLFTLLQPILMASQDPPDGQQHGRNSHSLTKTDQPVVLDGILDEESWRQADVVENFRQRDPEEGMPASERTEVRVLYDEENLYFGVTCFESRAEGILATELRRDNDFANDDSFAVILDTFHDHRNAFLFRINPAGTQYDALITEEGRDVNVSWDEKWGVETNVGEDGWTAEIQIPLKSIRFSSTDDEMIFGVDFERIIRRKNEFTAWNNYSRDFNMLQVSQAGHLRGMSEAGGSRLRLRVKPYITGQINTEGAADRNTNFLGDVGLEDLKVPITSGLTLDATINTDFAETEVDDQVINFDRVPVFFPERREFFLEGAGVFEFGVFRGEGRPQISLYHSRRIGLSEDGEEIPMLGGVKVTGKLSEKFSMGFLNAQTDNFGVQPGDNFTVFRLKRDILARSSVGAFFTNRQAEGGDFNRVLGIDQNLVLFEHLGLSGMLGRSFTDGVQDKEMIGGVTAEWQDDLIQSSFAYTHQDENFQTDLGFITRPGTRKLAGFFSISPRPDSDIIRQLYFAARIENFETVTTGELETRLGHVTYTTFFEDGSSIRFAPHYRKENHLEEFRLPGDLTVPAGVYSWWNYWLTYSLNPARKLSGQFSYRYEKDYYGKGGKRTNWGVGPVIKLSSRFSAELNYSFSQAQLPAATEPVDFHVVNSVFNFAFSRKWLTCTRIQYNSDRDVVGVNFRLNYIYRPGDDLFVVINAFGDRTDSPTDVDRSITVKLTHSFDF